MQSEAEVDEIDVAVLRGDMQLAGGHEHSASTVPGVVRAAGIRTHLPQPVRQWRVPSGLVKLVINFGSPIEVLEPRRLWRASADTTAWVVGPTTVPAATEWSRLHHCVFVHLTPLAAAAAFGMPMSELTDTIADIGDVLGARGRRLAERVAAADEGMRVALLRSSVERAVLTGAPADPRLTYASTCMRASNGRARVSRVADEVGLSRRHLTRAFQQQIGISPKRMSRLLRVQQAMLLLNRGTSMAETAMRCGYYDQPHLHNDFVELTGRSPSLLTPRSGVEFSLTGPIGPSSRRPR
ncbi:helix-turn-helix transcriptional regulator [Pseudonocardia sp. TRM90224]|uniref:helix-turn-helix transcriptional regulator n=1 Tax=Pseudonocardia sp. TRM90224 TaxID=2812678 RepID=UPI001E5BFBFD|nr:helix-turn-helix transcriptional regulator [Pseudonocardia sp. TRM90224]